MRSLRVVRWRVSWALMTLCGLLSSSSAGAQSVGLQAGVSAEPNQFFFGGHLETPPLVDALHFRPNVEVGLGDSVTVVAINVEFVYRFPPGVHGACTGAADRH